MKSDKILEELEILAEKLGLTVRYERGDFQGDLCFIDDDGVIIIQKKAIIEKKIAVLSRGMSRVDLRNVYVLPEIRKLLESKEKENAGESEGDLIDTKH
ncbi:MAG: hypothetical protein IIB39_08860 [Candidatus Marinimicrobia bacterium]|nr:hypothetical protein [Candidatus Neomarinimicrobiota bacterium]